MKGPGPTSPRWTHIALRVADIDSTVAWYQAYTPLELLARRSDDFGRSAWLAMSDQTDHPFVLVAAEFFPETDPYGHAPNAVLGPFAHLGFEMPTRAEVDEVAQRGEGDGCLAMPPTQMPDPIGYICMLKDPDGNTVEFSYDQGVYAAVQEVWGQTSA